MQETEETGVPLLALEDPLEQGMATHSSILVWRIQWTEKPGGLQSIVSQRVRHDQSNLTCMHALSSGFKNVSLQYILLFPCLILHHLTPASRNHLQNTLSAAQSLS